MATHVSDLMVSYLEDTLGQGARVDFERHVEACDVCAAEFARVEAGYAAAAALLAMEPAMAPALAPALPETNVMARPHRVPPLMRLMSAAAITLVAAWIGFALGRRATGQGSTADGLQAYALLFEEADWPPAGPLQRSGYGDFARALEREGRFGGGEKLTDETGWRVLPSGQAVRPMGSNFSGWFIVRAEDYAAALDLARRSPHRHWGSVLVRQLE